MDEISKCRQAATRITGNFCIINEGARTSKIGTEGKKKKKYARAAPFASRKSPRFVLSVEGIAFPRASFIII